MLRETVTARGGNSNLAPLSAEKQHVGMGIGGGRRFEMGQNQGVWGTGVPQRGPGDEVPRS